jgi:RNA polymerase sigma factor (sigma-70 family)
MTEKLENENELVLKAKQGDRAAFDALARYCARDIYNLCYRLCGNRASAEDIAQEAFVNAYINIGRFQHTGAFAGWVYRIAMNTWKNRVRYEKRRLYWKHDSLDESLETEDGHMQRQLPDDRPDPSEELGKKQKGELVQRALNGLGEDAKAMIVLRDIEEKSYEEIAGITGMALGTVKSRIARARDALRIKLQEMNEGDENE